MLGIFYNLDLADGSGGSHICESLLSCNIEMGGLQNTRSYGYILELHHFLKVDNVITLIKILSEHLSNFI